MSNPALPITSHIASTTPMLANSSAAKKAFPSLENDAIKHCVCLFLLVCHIYCVDVTAS